MNITGYKNKYKKIKKLILDLEDKIQIFKSEKFLDSYDKIIIRKLETRLDKVIKIKSICSDKIKILQKEYKERDKR